MTKIPLISPALTTKERTYLLNAYDSGWIGGKGHYIDKFEEKFAKYIGVQHAITCSNGTAALLLAYLATGMTADSKVVCPSQTFAATYNMAMVVSQNVRMVRSDTDTWNLNPKACDADYFVGVHLYGNPMDMGELYKFKGVFIEDCAEALGSTFKGKKVGSFGQVSTFSFHSAKTITTGEGGMVVTNDADIAKKIRHLKNHCMNDPYDHDGLGWNFRMTNLQAAIGLAQLERIDELIEKKMKIAKRYEELLSPKFGRQKDTRNSKVVKWLNVFSVEGSSAEIRSRLLQSGIETRPGFNCTNKFALPSGVELTQAEQDYVISVANDLINGA